MFFRIVNWVSADGFDPYDEWMRSCSLDDRDTTQSMVACLKNIGLKCKFVKDLNLDGLCELKTKSLEVRVYFFIDENQALIVGAGHKCTQKKDIIFAYERMKSYEYSKKNPY
jgi:putative component of toxin-antitoxin plasmid stabilization module